MTPKAVRNCIPSRRRWCAFRPTGGKNRTLFFNLRLELLLQPSPHPFTAFSFYFQFQITQDITGACLRVHAFAFGYWLLVLGVRNHPFFHYYGAGVKSRPF
jgi:hypothetical protein